jgi:DNA-binding NarL/FixJ family response regulator
MVALALNLTALVQALIGDLDAARAAAQEAFERCEHSGDLRHRMRSLKVLGLIELNKGNASAACGHFERVMRLAAEAGYADPGVLRFEADEIEALVQIGALDRAQERLDQLQERAAAVGRVSALAVAERSRGLLLAALGDTAGARDVLQATLLRHGSADQPIEEARTLLALGNVERRRRQKRSAREALQRAADIFDATGATRWAARARADLARVGGRQPAPGHLTTSEQRICELISDGRTNREIAEQLFLSPKTVEAHVSRIFAKVGVRSRRELRSRSSWSEPEGAND